MTFRPSRTITALSILAVALAGTLALAATEEKKGEIMFTDVPAQTKQFIAWDLEIQLTPEQEAVKKEALEALPAPCCSDNTAYTCCCPCNMSRSIWGLSKYLITEQGYDAMSVRLKVQEWIEAIGPDGFSGKVCYTGGCGRPMNKNGCGGMNHNHVAF